MQFKQRQEAQKIILRRCGAIVQENGRSVVTDCFQEKAAQFADLRKKGINYLEIEKELTK
jgi:hypothetical protein